MQQQIKIDVPDDTEVDTSQRLQYACNPFHKQGYIDIRVYLKGKEPEYIEVRDYLYQDENGDYEPGVLRIQSTFDENTTESFSGFVRWLGPKRKVEI